MFQIIRDTAEKAGKWTFSHIDDMSSYCNNIIDRKLETGDYTLEGYETILCIERKRNVSEFGINITEDRFRRELQRMENFRFRYLVCEFSINDILRFPIGSNIPRNRWDKIRLTPKFIMRKVAEIQVDHNISVVFAGDNSTAQTIAFNIMKRTAGVVCNEQTSIAF